MSNYQLSKSTFLKGLQCEKQLYLHKFHYDKKDQLSSAQKVKFEQGNLVGELAQKLFPNGKDASPENHFNMFDSVGITKDFLTSGVSIIYEATFYFNDVLAALDILVKDNEGWKAYEVKSSTSVKDTHIPDAAVQYYTIINSGLDLKDISIVHINNDYVRNGDLELKKLFNIVSVKDKVEEYLPKVPWEIERFKGVLKSKQVPTREIGTHCEKPYPCDYKGTCWKDVPTSSILDLSGLSMKKRFEMYNSGYQQVQDLHPDEVTLTDKQWDSVNAFKTGESVINKPELVEFIQDLKYPLYYLDFETFQTAIPLYDKSKPYQQQVFQYSLHIEDFNGSDLIHKEYLADGIIDPRLEFTTQLIQDCQGEGDILVYNLSFEKTRLKELIEIYPEYEEGLIKIIDRLKDLMIPFQKGWYKTPEMKGSYSIKNVLPALVPDHSYDHLEIKNGGDASSIFTTKLMGSFSGDWDKVRKQLLEYCSLDTKAMVLILHEILRKIES